MKFLRKVIRKTGRGIKKAFRGIGGAFKKVFGVFGKLGPIGSIALMFIMPGLGQMWSQGLGLATIRCWFYRTTSSKTGSS